MCGKRIDWQQWRRLWATAALVGSVLLLWLSWGRYRQSQLAATLVRLHVIAASDSDLDQRQKLAVRDGVLPVLRQTLEGAQDQQEAQKRIGQALERLSWSGGKALERAGGSGTVRVTLDRVPYPKRLSEDGSYSLPAGDYVSLRIIIGAGEGHNWWCVLFPDLGEGDAVTAMAEETPTEPLPNEPEYELRFFCLDWLHDVYQRIMQNYALRITNYAFP